jgi:hypothetical protein
MKVTKVPAPLPPPPTFNLTNLTTLEARVVRIALAKLAGGDVLVYGIDIEVLHKLRGDMDSAGCSMQWVFNG